MAHIAWNKGTIGVCYNTGRTHFKKGLIPWNKGKEMSRELRKKLAISTWKKGRVCKWKGTKGIMKPNKTSFQKGHKTWNTGKKCPEFSGINNPRWKGGQRRSTQGYIYILKPDHPFHNKMGYVLMSHLVIEEVLGRYLKPNEVVHHINKNPSDNRPENLKLFSNHSEHTKKAHSQIKWFRNKTHKQCSKCHIIKPRTDFSPQKHKSRQGDPNQNWCKKCHSEYQKLYKTTTDTSRE